MPSGRQFIQYTIGTETRTMPEWAALYSTDVNRIRYGMSKGLTLKEALEAPRRITGPRALKGRVLMSATVGGVTKSLSEWSKDTGLPRDMLAERQRKGWDEDRLLLPKGVRKDSPCYNDATIGGVTQALVYFVDAMGLSRLVVNRRIASGWPVLEALGLTPHKDLTPQAPVTRDTSPLITWKGETKTLHSWVAEQGLRRATVSKRLERGWTVEEALSKPAGLQPGRPSRSVS